jgi:hypothetical protein
MHVRRKKDVYVDERGAILLHFLAGFQRRQI